MKKYNKVVLKIEGKEFEIINLSHKYHQPIDEIGRPSGEVRGGLIKMQIYAENNLYFLEWVIDNNKIIDGEIEFLDEDKNEVVKVLSFQQSYCVNLNEEYAKSASGETAIEHIRLYCKQVSIEGHEFSSWES